MITISEDQRSAIREAALSVYPQEMCGFLTESGFIQCQNMADDPLTAFKISAVDYAKYHDQMTAVVHTHVPPSNKRVMFDVRTPSYEDLQGQKQTGAPWLIFSCDGIDISSEHVQLPRVPNQDYFNRPFIWFINDCYSLVQDYYHFELGIDLPPHKATTTFQDIRHLDCLFDEHLADYGFQKIEDEWKNGDLLLLDNGGFRRNHLGIYHDGMVYHQDTLSLSEPVSHFFGRINEVLRYVG